MLQTQSPLVLDVFSMIGPSGLILSSGLSHVLQSGRCAAQRPHFVYDRNNLSLGAEHDKYRS